MVISNVEIAAFFDDLADLLEIKGENPFKIRAYKNAARTIENLGTDISEMVYDGTDLSQIPTIGEHIALKIEEIVKTGKLAKLEALKHSFPPHLLDLLKVEGIGPKRTKLLYEKLHIDSLETLRKAAEEHRIKALDGFDEKLEQTILKGMLLAKKAGQRFLYSTAEPHAKALESYLRSAKDVSKVTVSGSFRRRKDTVGDLDIIVTSKSPSSLIDYFVAYPDIKEILSHGDTRSTVILNNHLQVDLRCVKDESYGAALHYFTGSKSHNIAIRKIAIDLGLKVNEYGIFNTKGKMIAGSTEEEMYKTVGLRYIEPELRENRGELEAARDNTLPKLLKTDDIKGDLHMHSVYSDGYNSVLEMAEAAKAMGYSYIAMTDHSAHIPIVHGMDQRKVRAQLEEIDRVNETLQDFTILKSAEVDILEDGSLVWPDSILKELDLVVGAIHDKFKLSAEKQTERILKAMDNPYLNILAHPTGRLIGEREAYEADMQRIFEEAKAKGCIMEINAQPKRLDLNDIYTKMAKEIGLKFALSTDAHNIETLHYMVYALNQARRGWLEKKDVVNTYDLSSLKNMLHRT
ncbi:MAG: DNA polymerase/3'-5' exonuclease PolX [Sulfurospirillaceae bacterium]|nr:DNA polymerase/3'-5' exonuclease PolX [Sulfurospirillaceae bacterium]